MHIIKVKLTIMIPNFIFHPLIVITVPKLYFCRTKGLGDLWHAK
jgi:hypothetical protein